MRNLSTARISTRCCQFAVLCDTLWQMATTTFSWSAILFWQIGAFNLQLPVAMY